MAGQSPQNWAANRPSWLSGSTNKQISPKPEVPDYMGDLNFLIKGQAGKAHQRESRPSINSAIRRRSRSPSPLQKRVSFRERDDLPPDHDDNYYIRMDASQWVGLMVMNVQTVTECLDLFHDLWRREIVCIRSFQDGTHRIVQFRTRAQMDGAMRTLPADYLRRSPGFSRPYIQPFVWRPKSDSVDPKRVRSRVLWTQVWTQVEDGEGPMAHIERARPPQGTSQGPEPKLADRISTPPQHASATKVVPDRVLEVGPHGQSLKTHSDNRIFADPLNKGIKPGSESLNGPGSHQYLTSDSAPAQIKLAKTIASYSFWWKIRADYQSRTRQCQTEVSQAESETARARAMEIQKQTQSKYQPRLIEAQGHIDKLEATLCEVFQDAVDTALVDSLDSSKTTTTHPDTPPEKKVPAEPNHGDTVVLKARVEILERLPPQVEYHDKALRHSGTRHDSQENRIKQIEARLMANPSQQDQRPSYNAPEFRIQELEARLQTEAEKQKTSDRRLLDLEKKLQEVLERSGPRDREQDARTTRWEERHSKSAARIKALETAKAELERHQASLVLRLNQAEAQLAAGAKALQPDSMQYAVQQQAQQDEANVQRQLKEHDTSIKALRKAVSERPPIEFLATKEEVKRSGEKQRSITDQLLIDINNLKRSGQKLTSAATSTEQSGHVDCELRSEALERQIMDLKSQLADTKSQTEDTKSCINNLALKSLHQDRSAVIDGVEAKVKDLGRRLTLAEQVAVKKEELESFKAELKAKTQSPPLEPASLEPSVDAIAKQVQTRVQGNLQQMTSRLGEVLQKDRNTVQELQAAVQKDREARQELQAGHEGLERKVNMLITTVDQNPQNPAQLEQLGRGVRTLEQKLEAFKCETNSSQAEMTKKLAECNSILTTNHKPMLEEIPMLKARVDHECQQWKAVSGQWSQELQKQDHRNQSMDHQIFCLTKWQDNFSTAEFYNKVVQAVQNMVPSDTQIKINSLERRTSVIEKTMTRGSSGGAGTPRQSHQQLPGNAQGQSQQRFQQQARQSYQSPQLQQQPYHSPQIQQPQMFPQQQQQQQQQPQ